MIRFDDPLPCFRCLDLARNRGAWRRKAAEAVTRALKEIRPFLVEDFDPAGFHPPPSSFCSTTLRFTGVGSTPPIATELPALAERVEVAAGSPSRRSAFELAIGALSRR